ncbi:hypothetical protein CC80DRAFT_498219 [Byssothecium circinans]|uniref:Uncharacterized protein n=1 Tax=Byssothecium circinans TaxID=147558 RepID=A0A6A5T9M5_9PLEO|nr:hypothetical protein CC80DRAFT_498219 [Byssothecium circinans]
MDPTAQPPAWRAYIHLYLPLLTSILLILFVANPFAHRLPIAASAIPTYLIGSLVYPANRPPTSEQSIRFTRKHDLYRAAVLFTYGRILGTPFNLGFYLMDFVMSYMTGAVIGERDVGQPQRRSEFFVHVLWTIGSGMLFMIIPPTTGILWSMAGAADRAIWRAAYLALVDDVVRVLAYPDVRNRKAKGIVVLVQAAMIALLVFWVRFRIAMADPDFQMGK